MELEGLKELEKILEERLKIKGIDLEKYDIDKIVQKVERKGILN